jgi:hypothetical protein
LKQDFDHGLNQQRYAGRPLLRLLDCYVLALTGNLAPDVEAKVAQAVQTAFGGGADWKASLRNALDLPPTIDEQVRGLWRAQPEGSDPLRFALAVSDANFLPMIDPT